LYGINWLYECYTAGNGRITNKQEVTRISQITINNVCDFIRKSIIGDLDKFRGNIKAIDFIV
jgi:hypothetical protein